MISETLKRDIDAALVQLHELNPNVTGNRKSDLPIGAGSRHGRLQKVLVANRGEIAKRFFLALHEEGIPSVAAVTNPDRGQSWYEFADELVFIGPQDNYATIPVIIGAVLLMNANAIYSGYGFLSENIDFVEALKMVSLERGHEILFMGPTPETMRLVGNKMSARCLALQHDIPLFESSGVLLRPDIAEAAIEVQRIGLPVIIKPCLGGGGKGVYPVHRESDLEAAIESTVRIGKNLYNDPSYYIEKFINNPVHIEVQIFNGWSIGIRKCAVQRRNQKIIEESGHSFLDNYVALSLLAAAEKIAHLSGYSNGGAGTVEFLIDTDTGKFGFMEMNTRLQVEYAVTDQSLGIDIAKWQILFFDGRENEIIGLDVLKNRMADNDHSIECRIYAEEPENDYLPSPGTILELDLPTFNGIRCDFGFMEGDTILPMYDPLIGKLIAHGATRKEAIIRLERALQELYINGVKTNINQLLRIVRHPLFAAGNYTNNLLKDNPELNFKELPVETAASDNRRIVKHIIFGAFCEHMRVLKQSIQEFIIIANLGSIIDAPSATDATSRYTLECQGNSYLIEFLQKSIDTFFAFVNGIYNGAITLNSINDRCDDFLIIFGSSSYRVRVNRHALFIDLRMKDELNKINYYRMRVIPEGAEEHENINKIFSPFQGSFVSFCKELHIGDDINAGDPILILSSMKMETTITAPESGKIVFLIEDGDLSRLSAGKTANGKTIGRSIHENELLAIIQTEPAQEKRPKKKQPVRLRTTPYPTRSTYDCIFNDGFESELIEHPDIHLKNIAELIYAAAQGYIYHSSIIETLRKAIRVFPSPLHDEAIREEIHDILNAILIHYTNIKKLFSPVVSEEGLSFQEELDQFISSRQINIETASRPFEKLLKTIYESYGIIRWDGRSEMSALAHEYVFVLLKRSYQFSQDQTDIIKRIVDIISSDPRPGKNVARTLTSLMEHEQAERDDSLLKFIKKVLSSQFNDEAISEGYRQPQLNGSMARKNMYVFFREQFHEGVAGLCAESLADPCQDSSVPAGEIPETIRDTIAGRIAILKKNFRVKRLYSPVLTVCVYLLEPHEAGGRRQYIAYSSVEFGTGRADIEPMENAFMHASTVLQLYQHIHRSATCWVEIFVRGTTIVWNDTGETGSIHYDVFKKFCSSSYVTAHDLSLRGIINIDVRYSSSEVLRNKQIVFFKKMDSFYMDYLLSIDRSNPYHDRTQGNVSNQRLFDAGKWPIEIWTEECLDPGSIRELRIPSIDELHTTPVSELHLINRPVGAKIFYGTINGSGACFYMKDSRVSGGATGSREGLKYIAAAYLSYLNDWPLYVWNDSAGANIMEGIISLNRGAEGFMMNTLLSERSDSVTFRRYVEHSADEDLKRLFHEINMHFNCSPDMIDPGHRSFQLTAVGIGSSAGLDVYGSSQASIQILLDSEESYRVLTGSKVVHTVIGEDITNYDIGGAKILGKWTGIVDILACDKIQLANTIYLIQSIFTSPKNIPAIKRFPASVTCEERINEAIVFNETVICNNVDDGIFLPFKENYYAAEALIGGFARIGGRRVLVMGPRTQSGLRSLASITKARELLRTAYRTGSHQILVFGSRWQQSPDYHESIQMRACMDFMTTLHKKSGLKIFLIAHPDGLKCYDINGAADVILYVKNKTDCSASVFFSEKNATRVVDSFEEGFDCAHRIISMIDPLAVPEAFTVPATSPSIPKDASEPYDMIESVIAHLFDAGSFLEFYRDMNNPITGPNLITGLARMAGFTVGVIADQPLLKGGGADAFGTEKFRVFTEFLNRSGIPLVMLSNSSGFVPGSQQERYRIQAIGAESLDTNILGTIPVVSVVLNQNYGGRLIHAFNKFLRPGIVYLALENAVMAVIGVDAAFDLLYGKKYARLIDQEKREKAEELRTTFMAGYLDKARAINDGTESRLVDWTIPDVADLRAHILKGLALAFRRCNEAFGARWPHEIDKF